VPHRHVILKLTVPAHIKKLASNKNHDRIQKGTEHPNGGRCLGFVHSSAHCRSKVLKRVVTHIKKRVCAHMHTHTHTHTHIRARTHTSCTIQHYQAQGSKHGQLKHQKIDTDPPHNVCASSLALQHTARLSALTQHTRHIHIYSTKPHTGAPTADCIKSYPMYTCSSRASPLLLCLPHSLMERNLQRPFSPSKSEGL
jgi:hypothetical protein